MPVVGRAETELPAEWPMLRRLPEGTAFIDLKVKAPASFQSWRFRASSHVSGYQPGMSVWSSAALGLVKDRPLVFMGSYDNNLYCLDALSGEKLWRFTTGDGIYSAPALYVEQSPPLVFVASSDRTVYALDADLGKRV